jgi:hypothetical protein
VKNRFQNSPFKCNLQRYTEEEAADAAAGAKKRGKKLSKKEQKEAEARWGSAR